MHRSIICRGYVCSFVESFADRWPPAQQLLRRGRPLPSLEKEHRSSEKRCATQNRQPLQSSVLTSSGRISTNVQLPVAIEQERIPRRNTLTGVLSGNVR